MGKPGRPGAAGRKAPWQPLLAIGKVGPRATPRHHNFRQRYEFRHQRTSPQQRTSLYRQRKSPYQRTSRQWHEPHPRSGAVGRSAPGRPAGPPLPDAPGLTAAATPSQLHRSDSECS